MSIVLAMQAIKGIKNKKKGKKTNPMDFISSAVGGTAGLLVHEFAKSPKGKSKKEKKQNVGNFVSRTAERIIVPGFTDVIDMQEDKREKDFKAIERWNIIGSPVKVKEYNDQLEISRQYDEYEKEVEKALQEEKLKLGQIGEGRIGNKKDNILSAGLFPDADLDNLVENAKKYALPALVGFAIYKVFVK